MACMFPYNVNNPLYGMPDQPARIPVPCGRCPDCVRRRVNEWSFRLQQEERNFALCYFVTLTYETPPLSPNGYMTLCKKHLQDYWQRIRMSFAVRENVNGRWRWNYDNVPKFKYYVCGEYGSRFNRPHYHAIVFGLDERTLVDNWQGVKTYDMASGEANSVDLGIVHIGTVTGASIGYTLKYMAKGKRVPEHGRDDRVPEFAMMSKRLGKSYLDKDVTSYHRKGNVMFLRNPDGFTISMPRYYKEKLWTKQERRKLALDSAALHERKEKERERKYVKKHGSLEGYDKARFEAKKAAIENSRRFASAKRKDL